MSRVQLNLYTLNSYDRVYTDNTNLLHVTIYTIFFTNTSIFQDFLEIMNRSFQNIKDTLDKCFLSGTCIVMSQTASNLH